MLSFYYFSKRYITKQQIKMGLSDCSKKKGINYEEFEAPDGGWGWMVAVGVAALFVSNKISYFDS